MQIERDRLVADLLRRPARHPHHQTGSFPRNLPFPLEYNREQMDTQEINEYFESGCSQPSMARNNGVRIG